MIAMQTITLAGGCFWCIEAIFQLVRGVEKVVSGYAGGGDLQPIYEGLHDGRFDHAEAVQVTFDESQISLDTLLDIFFFVHDPTTLNRQGNDVGRQYRSAVYYSDESQRQAADLAKKRAEQTWSKPVVTEITELDRFFEAEDHHQDYYNQNRSNPYCQIIVDPKIAKFRKNYAKYLM
jgi:peptide-methionine (S)-S-oxide reductase